MEPEFLAGLLGGSLGGVIGVAGAWLAGYWGPKRLEIDRERREEERVWGPRRELIREMLDKAAPGKGRSFEALKLVTGTPDDDLRRLLVEIGARGTKRPNGDEAWIYRSELPLPVQSNE